MSRSSANYSAKHTVSPEVKSISAKRLYRSVLECVKKLDAGHQHRRSLISLFQPNQVKLRHKLREACEKLLFTYPIEYGRKAEELLWKKVYYDVIHAVQSGRKFQSNAPGALQQRHLEPHFRQFLYSAMGFYHYLLLRLQSKVSSGLVEVDFSLARKPLHSRTNSTTGHSNYGMSKSTLDEDEKEMEEWMKSTSYRFLVCLGDLSRYQMEFGSSRARPNRFYQLALLARPNAGMPHNQLATLAGHHSWWGLVAAYHYCRSLHAEITFEGAESNLQRLLDRNKKLFYQLPTEALDTIVSADVYKKDHTRIFIVSFLYLCDLLRPKTYATDVEIAGLCKRLIDALLVCLTNINDEPQNSETELEENRTRFVEPVTNKVNTRTASGGKRSQNIGKPDSTAPSNTSLNSGKHHHNTQHQHRINEAIVFKISVLCLVNVHDLQSCRSNRSSAAVAFALAFLSHLLGHMVQSLSKESQSATEAAASKDSKAEGDRENGKNSRSRRSKARMRRRRRVGGRKGAVDGDLSEGEDTMAGGDAGSDSEASPDSDSDTETYSESSGSGTRLSQEDLSSHGEESDTPEAERPEKDFHLPEAKKTQPTGELPQQNVASLQDLSNKMFQPSSLRRKITLAPSFLQHLSSPKPAKIVEKETADDVIVTSQDVPKAEAKDNTDSFQAEEDKKPDIVQRTDAEKAAAVARLRLLARHHHVMAAVKLLADWLWANEGVAVACAKSSRALWSRLVCFVSLLPTERELMEMDEVRNDVGLVEQLNSVLTRPDTNGLEEGKDKEDEKSDEVSSDRKEEDEKLDKPKPKITIQKRKEPTESTARWRQTRSLPEDHVVHNMNAVRDANTKCGIDVSKPYVEMTDLQQVVMRTCRVRHLCRALSNVDDIDIDVTNRSETDDAVGDEQFTGPEEEAVDPQMELEAVEAMRKHRLMKDMATSRLRSEVAALESSLGNQQTRDSALCLHLVPTVAALCHELHCVRKLVASERFFITISRTVIDGLDYLKKELPGAREAIRYLEAEIKKGNRYILSQAPDGEKTAVVEGEPPRLRRTDVTAWQLYRLVECSYHLMAQEAKKTKTDISEHDGLVAILTRDGDSYTAEQSKALAAAKSKGIQVNSALTFSKSWTRIEAQ